MAKGRQVTAAVMPGADAEVELREFPVPDLETDSALLRVEFSEVCGTDVYLKQGLLEGVPYPIIPGHVSVGVLEQIRGTMCDVDGRPFEEGERVTFLDVHRTCHQCWYCLVAKASTRCPHRKVYGITYGVEDGLTGGWAEYVYLKPGVRCIRMGEVSSELFMAGGCSLPTALHAVDRAEIQLAETVLVLGSGPVGLSAIGFSVLSGASRVLCIGAPDGRLDVAGKMGATATLNFITHDDDARTEWVLSQTNGRGADVTIECTGAPAAVVQAMRYTRDAGRVVIVGQYTDHGEVAFNPHLDLNKKHIDIRGCWGSDYSHFHRSVEVLRGARATELWSAMTIERFPLSRTNEALAVVSEGRIVKALVVP